MIRKLGFCEARMHAMHSVLSGTTQCISSIGVRGTFDAVRFRAAVARVKSRYQILNVFIDDQQGSPAFVSAVGTDLDAEVSVVTGDWQLVFQQLNNRLLVRRLWSVTVVLPETTRQRQSWEMMIVSHHAVLDGYSADRLAREVLETYCQDGPADAANDPCRALPPAAEQLMSRTLSWDEFVSQQRETLGATSGIEPDPHVEPAPLGQRSTKSLFQSIPANITAELTTRAANADTTLNSWVTACLLRAAQGVSSSRSAFIVHTAFSLRQMCDDLEEVELGCYLAVIATRHEVTPARPLADLSREHGLLLRRALFTHLWHPHEVNFEQLKLVMEGLKDASSFIHDLAFTYIESSLPARIGELDIEHVAVSTNRALGTTSMVLHGVLQGGRLHLTGNFTSPVQSAQWVERVWHRLGTGLS